MSTFNIPYTASIKPLDLECPTPTSTLAKHNNASQTKMYRGSPANVSSPPQTNSHRVSKAMKGKRVHACQHPGCPKVSTLRISQMNYLADYHHTGFYQSRTPQTT